MPNDMIASASIRPPWSLDGRTALVTGAASGIGRASAITLARYGARVVVADIDLDGAHHTAAMITEGGDEAFATRCDVTDDTSVGAAITVAIDKYGQLDIAHNNAGVLGAQRRLVDYDDADWDRIIAVNLKGVFLCMRRELAHMIPRKSGVIINTASEAALEGQCRRRRLHSQQARCRRADVERRAGERSERASHRRHLPGCDQHWNDGYPRKRPGDRRTDAPDPADRPHGRAAGDRRSRRLAGLRRRVTRHRDPVPGRRWVVCLVSRRRRAQNEISTLP